MQNKKLVILFILTIVAALSLIRGILAPSGSKRQPVSSVTVAQSESLSGAAKTGSLRYAKRTSYASWARNPFVVSESGSNNSKGLILDGIVWDKKSPVAIINGNMVGIGDKVQENTVVDIKQDRVILNDGTGNFELMPGS